MPCLGLEQAASEHLPLKLKLFGALAAELRPDAILASNTSSISITKIAASTFPQNISAASEQGKLSAARVVGMFYLGTHRDHGLS